MPLLDSRKLLAKVAEQWPAKVLSIALALILFVFHRMSTLEDRFFSVPLHIETQGNMIPSSSYPRMVRISMRGDPNSIYPIMEDDIEAYIDLNQYEKAGSYHAPVQIRKKGTALGVEPLEIGVDPLEVSVALDQKISKFVPLAVNLRGQVENGYSFDSYTLNPTQVVIDGPREVLIDIRDLSTDFIDLDGRTGDFSMMVNILNRDPLIILRGNGVTEFHGFISKVIPVRLIKSIPISVQGLDNQFMAELETGSGSVRLEGSTQEALDGFIPPLDFLSVNCAGIEYPGTYTLPVRVIPSSDMTITKVEPENIKVLILSVELP